MFHPVIERRAVGAPVDVAVNQPGPPSQWGNPLEDFQMLRYGMVGNRKWCGEQDLNLHSLSAISA